MEKKIWEEKIDEHIHERYGHRFLREQEDEI